MRVLAASILAIASAWTLAAPEALLIQLPSPRGSKPDVNVAFLSYLAQELDDEGRVLPIAWSMTDPIFRAAVEDGHIKLPATYPSFEDASAIAKKLRIPYIVAVQVWQQEGTLHARGMLFKGEKALWRDPDPNSKELESQRRSLEAIKNNAEKVGATPPDVEMGQLDVRQIEIQIGQNGADLDGAARSLARTWTVLLGDGPLQSLPAHRRATAVEPDPGQKPVEIPAPPPVKVDNRELMQQLMKLLSEGKVDAGLALIRDAIDTEPTDPERRAALISTLLQAGRATEAAREARRAAELMPSHLEFRALAARAWLQAGQPDEAANDLNESIARDPESPVTRLMMGEVNLFRADFEAASPHFDAAIEKAATSEAHLKRAVCRALAGDATGMASDVEASKKLGLVEDPLLVSRIIFVGHVFDRQLDRAAGDTRSLFQRARVQPDEVEVETQRATMLQTTEAMISLLESVPAAELLKASSGKRLLALKLLSQCLSELGSYCKSKDPDQMTDATISLGEAIKASKAARDVMVSETTK